MKRIVLTAATIVGILLLLGCPTPNDPLPITYAVTVSPSGAESGETVTADVSEAAEGAVVTLTAALNSGRRVALSASGVTISPSTISTDGGTATFTMPSAQVEVTVTFSNIPTYAVTVSPGGAATGESLAADIYEAAEGATVTLTASLNSGRQVVLGASGVTISPSTIISNGGTATFTMPAVAVEVTATYSYYAGGMVGHTANSVNFNMNYVPSGGPFTMGEHVEEPTQEVTLTKNFWMGETEVTQGLWEDVWGTTWPGDLGYVPSSDYGLGDTYPAYYVNWYDTAAFCNLLTQADGSIAATEQVYYSDEGLTTSYTKANASNSDTVYVNYNKTGYRLPTEAEWEYTARYIDGSSWNNGDHVSGDTVYACYDAGSGVISGSPLASDTRISEYAWWYGNNSPSGSKVVGQKTANALGLRDMSGNVNERCCDWYADAYSGGSETDPMGPENGSLRVSRGCSWFCLEEHLRCATRFAGNPSTRDYLLGFRLCRTAD